MWDELLPMCGTVSFLGRAVDSHTVCGVGAGIHCWASSDHLKNYICLHMSAIVSS